MRQRHTGNRPWQILATAFLLLVGLLAPAAFGQDVPEADQAAARKAAAEQTLTWTAGDPIDKYLSAPTTAVAGPTTIVFENSEATGNTTSMPHTLTFDTSNPDYNNDVTLNILANPSDAEGGKHTAEVTLTPGKYRYHCTIPGHGTMEGVLEVTEGGGEDTTAPETDAKVDGTQNADGDYVGQATVTVTATDESGGSGVEKTEYALGDDGEWQPYTDPVVIDQVGDHKIRYRATDKAGNTSDEKTAEFSVVAPSGDDTDPPETSATVTGEENEDGAYVGTATVTVSASDAGSGVNKVEYAIGDGGWQDYTEPVAFQEAGSYTVKYRATDKAGNAAEAKEVAFEVVEPPAEDKTPPETSAKVEGTKNSNGAYVGTASVAVTATDDDSGVDKIEYSLDGAPFVAYDKAVVVDRLGRHTVAYRATDKAGNTAEAKSAGFTIVEGGGVPAPNCPEYDERDTVFLGEVDSGVPNRMTKSRCTIGELIEDEKDWSSQALFLKHVDEVLEDLLDEGVIDKRERKTVRQAAKQSGIGKPGQNTGYKPIFDGTQKSFDKWQQVGGGKFGLNPDGSITSSTEVEGMGMLWFPERKFENFSIKLQWRDDAPGNGNANGGLFVRFPQVHDHPEEDRPEWVAINYGHEIQMLDRPDGDMYKTGSVYGFDRVGLAGAGVTPKGTWNDYEVRVEDQHYSIFRNGELINEFDNTGGQVFEPPRDGDPGTDGRRYASGYVGLQVHGVTDVISYRDIRVKEL
ncbi:DUF1080 domain-containing protein [Streptomyces triticagri]|uniref:DUF1080 domain-containing protein n=1 Tax=Streptomyces triticagri TaxID=2293568 RepID=A0A372MBM7_9ACTN|nr:family 16 glycoside hydrolase [Streptomyces triticagri]RFU88010.1 DUF1080 domain-containing protein [Streptomyces triticagri]